MKVEIGKIYRRRDGQLTEPLCEPMEYRDGDNHTTLEDPLTTCRYQKELKGRAAPDRSEQPEDLVAEYFPNAPIPYFKESNTSFLFTYPLEVEVLPEEFGGQTGIVRAQFTDLPCVVVYGKGLADALLRAEKALGDSLCAYVDLWHPLPASSLEDSDSVHSAQPSSTVRLALAAYVSARAMGLSKHEFFESLGLDGQRICTVTGSWKSFDPEEFREIFIKPLADLGLI